MLRTFLPFMAFAIVMTSCIKEHDPSTNESSLFDSEIIDFESTQAFDPVFSSSATRCKGKNTYTDFELDLGSEDGIKRKRGESVPEFLDRIGVSGLCEGECSNEEKSCLPYSVSSSPKDDIVFTYHGGNPPKLAGVKPKKGANPNAASAKLKAKCRCQ